MKPFIIIIYCTISLFLASAKTAMAAPYTLRPDTSGTCYSAVQDTGVNPYSLGIAGNWRPYRTFAYYGARKESDANVTVTDIRKNGTFAKFVPFWNRQPADNTLKPAYDTAVWVWNAQSTLFNIKGYELENKDPLGRYNAGLYGYDNTLPVAVIQNAHYREALFEGFEDYDFGGNKDTTCSVTRNFDYRPYKATIDSNVAHSGKHSILVKADPVGVGTVVINTDTDDFDFAIKTGTISCFPGAVLLKGIRADSKVILPSFSPFAGKKMLVSVWIKEVQDCNCNSYTKSNLSIKTGTVSITALPSGNIIEGWQRVEKVVDIPAGATTFTITFNAESTGAYFDDLRIHPFNANMKSFAYDPVTLRLMAELDENNYATFYEYDDDGTLIRVKKETERGIKTITESRSALIKE